MERFTLRQLRYVDALARHGHFGQAAEACAISQPALSMQIKELERSLGTAIFERGGRQVVLTGFGAAFLERARDILRAAEDMSDLARAACERMVGRLRLGVIPTIAPYLLPTLAPQLARSHPGLDIHVRESLTGKLIQELVAGGLDAAIVALPVSEPLLTEAPLFSEKFLLVRPRAQAGAPVPDSAALRDMRLLLLEEGHCFRDQALSLCNLSPAPVRDGLDASSLTTLVQMVGAGLGVTLIPEMAEAVETRSATVSVNRLAAPEPQRQVGMVWRKSSPMGGHLRRISEIVGAAGAGLVAEAPSRRQAQSGNPHIR